MNLDSALDCGLRIAKQTCRVAFLLIASANASWAQGLFITEFMAVRSISALDNDGDPGDFIEIYNNGPDAVDLGGYFLSDDCEDRFKWTIPANVEIGSGQFLVVWATEKDRTDPCCPLHTSFRLNGDSGCVTLTDPLGDEIHAYPFYPNQQLGYTYGLPMDGGADVELLSLVEPGAPCTAHIPPASPSSTDLSWTEPGFNDASWIAGTTGVGYDTEPDFHPFIGLDVIAMQNNNASCYVRIPFQIADPAEVTFLDAHGLSPIGFEMKYDDGYIAYINGTRVTSRNAPAAPTSTSIATADRVDDVGTTVYEEATFDEGAPTLVSGENILAIHVLNRSADSSDLLALPRLGGIRITIDEGTGLLGTDPHYLDVPTPGTPNVSGAPGVSEKPIFSDPSGAYPPGHSVDLSVEVPVAGTEIRYTLNESVPDENSPLYTAPINVTGEVVIAARAFQPGLLPSKPVFKHYLILGADVLDFDSSVPLVVCSTLGRTIVPPPTGCTGSYTSGRFLLFTPGDDGRAALTDDVHHEHLAAYRRRGNPSFGCGYPKFFFNMEFRDREGKDDDEQLFDDFASHSDYVMGTPYVFEPAFMRNAIAHWMSREIGQYAPRTRFVECFLHTRGNQALTMASYFGVCVIIERCKRGVGRIDINRLDPGDNEEPDVTGGYILQRDRIKAGDVGIAAGGYSNIVVEYPKLPTPAQKTYITTYLNAAIDSLNPDIGSQADSSYIDVQSMIDHHILNWFLGNVDALRLSTYMYKPRSGLLVFGPLWDMDRSMGTVVAGVENRSVNPESWDTPGGTLWWDGPGPPGDGQFLGSWYSELFGGARPLGDSPWARAYRRRWLELREGPLSTQNISGQMDAWAEVLLEPAGRNRQRWPEISLRGGSYLGEVVYLKNWLATRASWIDEQFAGILNHPPIEPPTFSHPGGQVQPGLQVEISADEGEIFYTLNGPDPRAADGFPSAEAIAYSGPITITGNTRIRAQARFDGNWSDPSETGFVTEATSLVVTEIMYNPSAFPGSVFSRSLAEFLEFYNPSDEPMDLRSVNLEDPFFDFSDSAIPILDPGGYLVVVRNLEAFNERHGGQGIPIGGVFSGSLRNSSQNLRLTDGAGTAILDFTYQDSWEPSTDGVGHSLVIVSPTADPSTWNLASSWRASLEDGGSPGREDPPVGGRLQGDLDGTGSLDITDVSGFLFNLFGQLTVAPCATEQANTAVQDVDGDGVLTVNDAVRLLRYLFLAGTPPNMGVGCTPISRCPNACEI